MRKLIGTILVVLGLFAALVGFGAAPASAHVGTVNVTCKSVSVALSKYNTSHGPNHVTVTINNQNVVDTNFATTFNQTYSTNGKGFTWQVVVHASDDQRFSFTKSGQQAACPTKPCPTVTVTKIETVPGPTVTKTATVTVTQTVTASPVTSTVTTTLPGTVVSLPGKTVTQKETLTKLIKVNSTGGSSTTTLTSSNVKSLPRTGVNVAKTVNLAGWVIVAGGLLVLFGGFRIERRRH